MDKQNLSRDTFATVDDASQWLHNKLGSSTHLWSFSSTVVSQYNVDKLQSIRDCFSTLDSVVKFKFFLSLFHIPKRNIEEFKPIVQEILDNTIQTCLDQWVLSIATFLQTYWTTQTLDTTDIEYDLESFKESYNDLIKTFKECVETETSCDRVKFLLPIECDYLNKEARIASLPNNPCLFNDILKQCNQSPMDDISSGGYSASMMFNAKKHFNMIKTSKTASALDDLRFKASHYSKNKTTKSLIVNSGYNEGSSFGNSGLFGDYGVLNSMSSSHHQTTLPGLATNKVPYANRFMSSSKRIESMTSAFNNTNSLSDTPSKLYSGGSSSNKASSGFFGGSSSFFKRSTSSNTSSTTITGKSSVIKRDVGIKLLDVQEQMISPKEAKRKRKEQEKEILKKQKTEQVQNEKDNVIDKEKDVDTDGEDPKMETKSVENVDVKNITPVSTADKEETNMAVSMLVKEENVPNQQFEPMNIASNNSILRTNDYTTPNLPTLGGMSDQNLGQNVPRYIDYQQQQHQQNQNQYLSNPEVYQQQPDSRGYNNYFSNNTFSSPLSSYPNDMNNSGGSSPASQNKLNPFETKQTQILNATKTSTNSLSTFVTNTNPVSYMNNQQLPSMNSQPPPGPQPLSSYPNFPTSHQATNMQYQQQNHQMLQQQLPPLPQQQHTQPHQTQLQHQVQAQAPHQSLSLTREQMLQAQEMFSNSNKLTRPEKALILGFIAGSRENPQPEHGPLITIKLNESEEILTSNGQQQKVLSELYFQMNYDTGEYKKIKKCKPIALA